MSDMPIPLVDLKAQLRGIRTEIDSAISETLDQTAFIMGDRVRRFEREFAKYCGTSHGVGASSGTTALHLALVAAGVGPGDEVITVSHTFIATAEAILHCGAIPVLVDVDPETYTMDPQRLEEVLTSATKAIIPVHLYGQCADMTAISAFASTHGLKVIEDAAQAHGAMWEGKMAGAIGEAGCFSFFPGKNLGAAGDGGAVVTNNDQMAERMSSLANHGRQTKYLHDVLGFNYRLDALQAAVLSVKLRYLDDWTDRRRGAAKRYNELLRDLPVELPVERDRHVYHLYVIQCDRRDELLALMKSRNIFAGIHYPIPLHKQPCFLSGEAVRSGPMPVTERVADRIVSLPLFPEITSEQQERVTESIHDFFRA